MNSKRHKRLLLFVTCLCMALLICPPASGQTDEELYMARMQMLEIESKLYSFYDQLHEISAKLPECTAEEISGIIRQVNAIDTKWNTYCQARQYEIAENDSLLQIVTNYQLARQVLSDSIAGKQHFFDAQQSISEAETFFAAQDSIYGKLYTTALEYSLVKATAKQLETTKGKEQLMFAEAQDIYEKAKSCAQEFGTFRPRFQKIEEKYIEIKSTSEKIQAMEYKPLLQRIKDYLYGLAAVALILMFVNMLQAKIKALKQARENARKLKEMINGGEDDYPTI